MSDPKISKADSSDDEDMKDAVWKNIPHGRPKSGRLWKEPRPVSLSKIAKPKVLKTAWEKRMKDRAEKKSIKEYERNLKMDIRKRLEEKRKRQELNIQRQKENEQKSEVVQVIKNTAKIKRMRKKQLRQIKKRAE